MTTENRSDEAKRESDPKDGIEAKEALSDEQLASIAAGRFARRAEAPIALPMLEQSVAPIELKRARG